MTLIHLALEAVANSVSVPAPTSSEVYHYCVTLSGRSVLAAHDLLLTNFHLGSAYVATFEMRTTDPVQIAAAQEWLERRVSEDAPRTGILHARCLENPIPAWESVP